VTTMTLNASEFNKAILGVHRDTGFLIEFIVADQMALWAKTLLQYTLPSKKITTGGSDKKIGMEAVRKDIEGKFGDGGALFVVVDNGSIQSEWEAVKNGVTYDAHIFKTKKGRVFGVEKHMIDYSGSRIAAHHAKYRSPTTGQVTKAGTFTKDIGRWKFVDKLVVTKAALKAHVKKMQQDVGKPSAI